MWITCPDCGQGGEYPKAKPGAPLRCPCGYRGVVPEPGARAPVVEVPWRVLGSVGLVAIIVGLIYIETSGKVVAGAGLGVVVAVTLALMAWAVLLAVAPVMTWLNLRRLNQTQDRMLHVLEQMLLRMGREK
jgi:hypothetical protein